MIKLLHVDDSSDDLLLIKTRLRRLSSRLEIERAGSVEEAFDKLDEELFDCILSDFQMPGMDGLEFLQTLRKSGNDIPFIFLTGQGNEELAVHALRSGADDYFTKEEGFAQYERLLNSIGRAVLAHNREQEKHEAEMALRESEEKYRSLVETSQDLIWRCDTEAKFIYLNPVWERLTGYSLEEMIGHPLSEFQEELIGKNGMRMFDELLSGGMISGFETRVISKSGETVYLFFHATPIVDRNGKIIGAQGIAVNISKRKRSEILQKAVYSIIDAVNSVNSLNELYVSIHEIIGTLMPARNFYIALYDESKELLSFPYFVDEKDEPPSDFKIGQGGVTEYVLRTGKPLLATPEAIKSLKEKGEIKILGSMSVDWLGVPLKVHSKVIGVLGVQSYDKRIRFGPEEQKLLVMVSAQVALAIERKQLEEKVHKLSRAVTQSPALVMITDIDCNIEYCNPKFYETTGYSVEEVIGKTPKLLRTGNTSEKEYNDLWETILEGSEWRGEFLNKKRNGELFWEYAIISPIRNSDGKITNFFKISEDITERKEAEQALEESEERVRILTQGVSDALVTADYRGKIISWNRAAEELFGYQEKEILGKPLSHLMPKKCHDFHKLGIAEFFSSSDSNVTGKTIEVIGKKKDGTEFQLELSLSPWETSSDRFVLGIIRDITGLQQTEKALAKSEERLRLMVENMPVMMYAMDENQVVVAWNQESERITGYSKEEIVNNPRAQELLLPSSEYREQVREKFAKTSGNYTNWEVEVTCKDGAVKTLSLSSLSDKLPIDGWAWWGIGIDLTESKYIEADLKQSLEVISERNRELAGANKELETFSYTVSHDLRAPLRSIEGFSRIMLNEYSDKVDDRGKKYLKRTMDAAGRMSDLISGILNLSRVTLADEMKCSKINLSDLVRAASQEIKQTDPDRKIKFVIEDKLYTVGDPQLMRIVIENLLANAWKFTNNHHPGRIEFGLLRNNGNSAFFVKDNGIGFDENDTDKLFEPFQRLHNGKNFDGIGIGLATVAKIINRHGGKVWAKPNKKKGATFYFTLTE